MVHGLFVAVVDGRAEHVIESGVAGLLVDGGHLEVVSVTLHWLVWTDDLALVDLVGELLSCLSCWVGLVIKRLILIWLSLCFRMELNVVVAVSTCSCHLYLHWFGCVCIVIVILWLQCYSFGVMSCRISIIFLLFRLVLLRLRWIQRIRIISQSLSPICRQFLSLLTFQLPLPSIRLIQQPILADPQLIERTAEANPAIGERSRRVARSNTGNDARFEGIFALQKVQLGSRVIMRGGSWLIFVEKLIIFSKEVVAVVIWNKRINHDYCLTKKIPSSIPTPTPTF